MAQTRRTSKQSNQAGGTFLGVVLGLIVGLAIAVIVALYITRSPSPFVAKVPPPSPEDSASGAQPFDPNRSLQGKTPGQPVAPQAASQAASSPAQPPLLPAPQIVEEPSGNTPQPAAPSPAPSQGSGANSGLLSPTPVPSQAAVRKQQEPAPAASAGTPPAKVQATKPAAPAGNSAGAAPNAETNSIYYLQVGAYTTQADAEQQRARLGFQGFESKVSTRDVNGTTYYRVRIGPFSKFDDMNSARQRLSEAGIDTAVLRTVKQ
jgi:cell division protein FtsN